MSNLEVRNVSPELRRRLESRAAREGLTLSEYVLRLLEADAEMLTAGELLSCAQKRAPVGVEPGVINALIRAERDSQWSASDR